MYREEEADGMSLLIKTPVQYVWAAINVRAEVVLIRMQPSQLPLLNCNVRHEGRLVNFDHLFNPLY
jgi:hypothetical protein